MKLKTSLCSILLVIFFNNPVALGCNADDEDRENPLAKKMRRIEKGEKEMKQKKLTSYFGKSTESDDKLPAHSPSILDPFKKPVFAGIEHTHEGPYLLIDDFGTPAKVLRSRLPIWNAELRFGFSEQYYCIGRYDIDSFLAEPCPEKKQTNGKFQRCYKCNSALQFNPSFYNVPIDSLSEKQRRYNMNPHLVYLAYFGGDSVKVGTANSQRSQTRLLEQGARAALVLGEFEDAYKARDLEVSVSSKCEITEQMMKVHKRKLIDGSYSFETARKLLIESRSSISSILSREFSENEPFDLESFYTAEQLTKTPDDISNDKAPTIAGLGVGVVGDVLIFQDPRNLKMLSLTKLLGRVLTKLPK